LWGCGSVMLLLAWPFLWWGWKAIDRKIDKGLE
jgi:hypothetical protein